MANLIQNLTSISPELRSGPSPGRRLMAVVLCAMLVLGATFPGFAVAGEADSEGEGTTPTVEVPVGPPDFDPGGEETDLEEEAPAEGEEQGGAVEAEAEVEIEAPAPEGATGAATEAPPPTSVPSPEPATSAPASEPAEQEVAPPAQPVANQPIVAPKQRPVDRSTASSAETATTTSESASPVEPAQQEAPSPSPRPVTATPADQGRNLAGKDTYLVRPGDCLWHIAAGLLPGGAGTQEIAGEVQRLWRLNEDRIGTGDPSLIYPGTELRLR
ncbi:MAG TPA: hypothetical protein VFS64_00220 [Solirubrobacterales bacterium]|nr:hypothetical protein [Solirubrobacterales bacterium]